MSRYQGMRLAALEVPKPTRRQIDEAVLALYAVSAPGSALAELRQHVNVLVVASTKGVSG